MAESSKRKQPGRNHRPSGLRHVEQVYDSDAVIPETQLEAGDEQSSDPSLENLAAEDLAVVRRYHYKPATSSQSSALPFETFGFVKPIATETVNFSFGPAKQATNKTPPRDVAPTSQPFVHPDTAVPSIENSASRAHLQDTNLGPASSTVFPPPTIEEHVTIETSQQGQASSVQDQLPEPSDSGAAPVLVVSTENTKSGPMRADFITQTTSQPVVPATSITKMARNGKKTKKGKKVLLSRSLVPWPPRHDPASGSFSPPSTAVSTTDHIPLKQRPEMIRLAHDEENLAVKPHNGDLRVPVDGVSNTRNQSSTMVGTLNLNAESTHTHTGDQQQVESAVATQHGGPLHRAIQKPLNIESSLELADDPSFLASHEGQDHFVQELQASKIDIGVRGPSPAYDPIPPQLTKVSKLSRKAEAMLARGLSHAEQQSISNTLTTALEQVPAVPPLLESTQDVLHGVSSRAGPTRVTRPQKKIRSVRDTRLDASTAAGDGQVSSKTTALDRALNGIRIACMADQKQLEEQMASAVNSLQEDKVQLRSTMLEQQTTIAELRVQLKTSERSLVRLNEDAKTIQRYATGLQKDYEKCKKAGLGFEKETKQILQDQLAHFEKAKADLGVEVNLAKESFDKDRSKLKNLVNETHIQLTIVSARKDDLEKSLTEQTRMYEAEKTRRTELEKELLLSVQSVQRQLSENSTILIDKLNSIETSLDSRASEDRNDRNIRDCLQILQKLESFPLLTAQDVRRAESMLRFVHKRANAGFDLLARSFESKTVPVEDIRQCMRDEIQGLRTEIIRQDQAIEDGHLAQETSETLREALDTRKQIHQQLEQQVNSLQQSEMALKSSVAQLEKEKDELQAAVQEHALQLPEFELEVTKLHDQLSQADEELRRANSSVRESEHAQLEQERGYCEYRSSAMAHLASLRQQMQRLADQLQINEREHDALQRDLAESKIELKSVKTRHDQLLTEVAQHESMNSTLRQEKDRLEEKYGASQMSLRSAEEQMQALEANKSELMDSLGEARTALHLAKDAETRLTTQYSGLKQELAKSQNAKNATEERVRQAQHDAAVKLQQANQKHTTELKDLESRLCLSENALKESQAKVRQMEAAHKEQLGCLEQKANARFEQLKVDSQQEQDKLKAQQKREMTHLQQKLNAKIEELERHVGLSTIETLVPNSQPVLPQGTIYSATQQFQPLRTRKKVDRQTNSVMVVVPSSSRRLDTDERASTTDHMDRPRNDREGLEQQADYFEEEYRNRFGTQVSLQEHETNQSLQEPNAEVVPETHEFEHAQGFPTQLELIESQMSAGGKVNQEESDLSTMPSEDLSEMLLDNGSDPGRRLTDSRPLSSPKDIVQRYGHPGQDLASDTPSPTSKGRPKSRANTASRMMPLPVHDTQHLRIQAQDGAQDLIPTHDDRDSRPDNSDPPEFMNPDNAASRRPYAQRNSMHDTTRIGDTDPSQKRKSVHDAEHSGPFKKPRNSTQSFAQRPASRTKSYAPYTPTATGTTSRTEINPSPSSTTGRRSSNRQSSASVSQASTTRLSSTRNTRSKANRYADRFEQELDNAR